MAEQWLSQRTLTFDSSGIRKVFDLAERMERPINLSIGQPDFDVPEDAKRAAIDAIQQGKNGYSVTQGIAPLRERLQAEVAQRYGHADRGVLITSGTSGGLVLAMLALIDPGDEVIVFDPYFVMYPPLVSMVGGNVVLVDTYPDFRLPVDRVKEAITPRTKAILLNSPANPTGVVASEAEIRAIAQLAAERNIVLVSDEIYRLYCYDEPFFSPAEVNEQTLVLEGFSKTHGMTGWRVGVAHGPTALIEAMTRLQQFTFVCAPHPLQWGALAAVDIDMEAFRTTYRRKRDRVLEALGERFEIASPGGAFYMFPKAPWGSGREFVDAALANELLIIPGNVFSRRDTHFRLSYAADDETLERGIEMLLRLAQQGGPRR